jgi:hypothetical protein
VGERRGVSERDIPPPSPPPPLRLRTRAAKKKKYFLAEAIHRALSPHCAIAFSVTGRRLKKPKRELSLGNGGSKTLGLLHEEGRTGAGRGQNQTTPGAPARADFCTSGMGAPSGSRTLAPRPARAPGRRCSPRLASPGLCGASADHRQPRSGTAGHFQGPWASMGTTGTL